MLPTHNKRANGGPPGGLNLQSAFDRGMNLAGIKSTKAGSGDKERAYIIRQNWALKTMLLLIVFFSIGMMVLFSTVLEVTVTRREAMKSEKIHHELEHKAQVRLMRAHLELQRALETEIHETSRFEEFRSMMENAMGTHTKSISNLLKDKNIEHHVIEAVEKQTEKLREDLDIRFDAFLAHFKTVANHAKTSLKKVANAIQSDVELDSKEAQRYKEKMMNDFGVNVEDEDAKRSREQAKNYDHYGVFEEDGHDLEEEDEDDEEIGQELERFFKKLNAHDFPVLSKDIIDAWEKDMQEISRTLADDDKETDLKAITDRVNQKIGMHAPQVEKFDPSKHSSVIDYFEMRIEEAKLSYHKQSLMDLYAGWKDDGKLSVYTVLSGLEHLAEENNMYLLYEWLDEAEDPDSI